MIEVPLALEPALIDLRDKVLAENEKVNLTALRVPEKCWIGNILDSLGFLEILGTIGTPKTLLDVGTGGGFPLLPLAIAMPQAQFTGLDSTGKKIEAIRRIATALSLPNVTLVTGRAEEMARDKDHRDHYDCVTARAVAELSTLLEFTIPFARVGGHVVLWKSLQATDEIERSKAAQKELKCSLILQHTYELPGDFGARQLLVFKKDAGTPKTYPRATGIPGKTPIS